MDHSASNPEPQSPPSVVGEPVTIARRGTTCFACNYDLTGQRVVNEQYYRMNVVTCPECGAVIPYGPRYRGRRAERRRAAVIAFVWLTLILTLITGVGASLMGLAQSTGFAASIPLGNEISRVFDSSDRAMTVATGTNWIAHEDRQSLWERISPNWWDDVSSEFIAERGGIAGVTDWIVLTDLLYLFLIALPLGVLWRVLFMHSGWIVNGVCLGAAFGLGALFLRLYFVTLQLPMYGRMAIHIAEDHVGWPIAWLSYTVGCIAFIAMLPVAGLVLRVVTTRLSPPSIRAKLWKFDPSVAV